MTTPAYTCILPYGYRVSHESRCKKALGFLGTFMSLLAVAFGVYVCIRWEEDIDDKFAYGVPLILIVTKNIIPYVCKLCVEFEVRND